MTVNDWLTRWEQLHALRVRPNTIRGYRAALAHLSAGFRALDCNQVTGMDWECEIARVAATMPRQAQIMHAALRKAWNDGIRLRMIDLENRPYLYAEGPRHRAKTAAYLQPEEIAAYVREAVKQPAAVPLLLMVLCGLRRGEALGLTWADIDEGGGWLHIRQQVYNGQITELKSITSNRDLPVNLTLIKYLYRHGDNNSKMLYNMGVKCLYRSHRAALAAAGIDRGITLHGLRHSCATAALAAGADVKTVQSILGHAHYATTADIYCHALMSAEREALDAISRAAGTRLEIA